MNDIKTCLGQYLINGVDKRFINLLLHNLIGQIIQPWYKYNNYTPCTYNVPTYTLASALHTAYVNIHKLCTADKNLLSAAQHVLTMQHIANIKEIHSTTQLIYTLNCTYLIEVYIYIQIKISTYTTCTCICMNMNINIIHVQYVH